MNFFEASFEEFCEARGYRRDETARIIWRTEAGILFAQIKASAHYHNGVPCRDAHQDQEKMS